MARPNAHNRRILRKRIAARDKGICQLCLTPCAMELAGTRNQHPDAPTLDHIDQQWAGGRWVPENLQLVHRECNNLKSVYDQIVRDEVFETLVTPGQTDDYHQDCRDHANGIRKPDQRNSNPVDKGGDQNHNESVQ